MRDQKIAYVDLSTGEVRKELIPEKMRQMYLGGRGIDVYLLYNHIPPGIDALSPENVLTVSAGLIGGTLAPSSGRCHIGGKSPLTGLIGSSNMGGFFAPELRFAGFDHLLVKGKAERPVYLWIHDGEIEIRDAAHLWGKDTAETPAIIKRDHQDEDIKVTCIGVAGENLVRFANVLGGIKNAAGRTGMGCVMGSKNLKAIAARGTQGLPISYPAEALGDLERLTGLIRDNVVFKGLSTMGTPMFHGDSNVIGRLRVRNAQRNQIPGPAGETLYADQLEKFSIGMAACFGCPVHCRHRYIVPEGPDQGKYVEGPEWSTLAALGTEMDIGRMEAVLVGNNLVNKYGIDSLEFGSMASWAIELYEKGIIDDKVTGGLKLEWGNEQIMYEMIRQIAEREGLGDILAEGPLRAIEKLGEESRFYNVQIKGMSSLHTDERATPAMALGIAVSTRGADHMRSRPGLDAVMPPPEIRDRWFGFATPPEITSYEGSAKLIWWHELMYTVSDALGVCKFQALFLSPSTLSYDDYCKLTGYITGLEMSASEMMEAGERIYTLERMFNNREGAGRKDDTLPERYFEEPTPLGIPSFQGKTIDREKFEQQLDEYYQAHGWDSNGVPTPETLEKLGLDKEPSHII
ncbi:MAG: aldehyde ferredoxin oxidoreductase family protein [Dehalococcoidia bacterium]|nr:aldehyde ferredoxin oxidoreductase family protein [Dehalococcoidia bacterium]